MVDNENTPDYIGHRQRLKDRFLKDGGHCFPDYELLEIMLMIAIPRKDVKPIAKALLRRFGSFGKVLYAPKEELFTISGIKENANLVFKVITAAVERITWESLNSDSRACLPDPQAIIDYCRAKIAFSDVEEFFLIFLDSNKQVIDSMLMQRGTIDTVHVHAREINREILKRNAYYVILAHNHPSGQVKPSDADIHTTQDIASGCKSSGIRVLDHIIISPTGYYSFAEHGLIFDI